MTLVPHLLCWAIMSDGSCLEVNRKEEMEGGKFLVISAMRLSGIGPGPLGISETKPTADAPYLMASHASSTLAMQQIFTLGVKTDSIIACRLSPSYRFMKHREKEFVAHANHATAELMNQKS